MNSLTRRGFATGGLAAAGLFGLGLPARATADVEWGIAVEGQPFREDAAYRDAIARTAELIVPMNGFKWGPMRYDRAGFDFTEAEEVVSFAEGLGLPVHGHTLLWYAYNPPWLDALTGRSELVDVLEAHIAEVVGRYRGRVRSWDVINEVVAHDPITQGRWRDGVWRRVLGPQQVEIAFAAAHAADPAARLFINDYDLEDDTPRTRERQDAVLAIVRRLQKRNLPVHAIGMQAHLYAERTIGTANLRRFIRELAAMGVGVAVTELDVIDWRLPKDPVTRDALVANTARAFLDTVFDETVPEFVATWGLSDRYSWIGDTFPRLDSAKARPLPLDRDLGRKPLFDVLEEYVGARP